MSSQYMPGLTGEVKQNRNADPMADRPVNGGNQSIPSIGDAEIAPQGDGYDPGYAAFLAEYNPAGDDEDGEAAYFCDDPSFAAYLIECARPRSISTYRAWLDAEIAREEAEEAVWQVAWGRRLTEAELAPWDRAVDAWNDSEAGRAEFEPFAKAVAAGRARGSDALAGDIHEAMQRAYDDPGYRADLIERGIPHPSNQTYKDYWMEHGAARGITLGYDALEQLRRGEAWIDPKVAKPAPEEARPLDLFAADAPQPVLTRDMLPDSPTVEYAFDVAELQGVEPAMSVAAMLTVCAAAIHDGIKIERKPGHTERAHANFAIVADSGTGKSPAINPFVAALANVERRERAASELKFNAYAFAKKIYDEREKAYIQNLRKQSPSGDVMAMTAGFTLQPPVKPVRQQWIVNEATTESMHPVMRDNPRGLLNHQDEMSGFIASFDAYRNGKGGKDQSFWLSTDDGRPYNRNRSAEGGSYVIENASCCFIGGIQPDKLRPLVGDLASDGFLQRTFVVYGAANAAGELFREENADAKAAYERLIEGLVKLDPATLAEPVRLDWQAIPVRDEIEAVAKAMIAMPTTPEHLRQHLSKWRGKVARTMLLFHVIESVSRGEPVGPYLSVETAQRVKAFMLRFILPNAMRFYDEFFRNADATGQDMRWSAGYILAHRLERVTLSAVCEAYNLKPQTDRYRVTEAMGRLANAGWVGDAVENATKRSTTWMVNRKVHAIYAERAAAEKTRREAVRRKITEAADLLRREGLAK